MVMYTTCINQSDSLEEASNERKLFMFRIIVRPVYQYVTMELYTSGHIPLSCLYNFRENHH